MIPVVDSNITLENAHLRAQALIEDPDVDTPFLRRVAAHMEIDDSCRDYLRSLQSEPMVFGQGVEVVRAETESTSIFIVQYGWLIGYTHTSAGQRYVHRVYQPGDFIAIEDINWAYRSASTASVTPCVLTSFTKTRLRQIFEESPRLSRTIFSIVAMTQVQSYDLSRAVGRLPAENRLADFLLQIHSRSKVAGTLVNDSILYLPLTQTEVGDAIGLTNVSVSRAFTSLERKGLILREGRLIHLLEPRELARIGDFTDRHADIDREWIGSISDGERRRTA